MSKKHEELNVIINSESILNNDIRDIITFLMSFLKKNKSISSKIVFYDMSNKENIFFKFSKLIQCKIVKINNLNELNQIHDLQKEQNLFVFQKHIYDLIKKNQF